MFAAAFALRDRLITKFHLLRDLEEVLRSKPEQVTVQEESLIRGWENRDASNFYIGVGGGSAVAFLATRRLCIPQCLTLSPSPYRRLPIPIRLALTSWAGIVCGLSLFFWSRMSSIEHILSLEGSRIQREMANILLKKRHDDPWVRLLVFKHFYTEEVYVDLSTDKPVFRLRYRNLSGESVTHSQSTTSYGAEETNPKEKKIDNTRKLEPWQQVSATAAADTEDLFDLVLGVSGSTDDDDPQSTNAPLEPSGRQTRKERRSRRKHRRQHRHEESDDG